MTIERAVPQDTSLHHKHAKHPGFRLEAKGPTTSQTTATVEPNISAVMCGEQVHKESLFQPAEIRAWLDKLQDEQR